ncbi:helix-turn-helix domain-containing protein [Klebsiella pneumoniae]|uniref:TetR/AcrR family transcriptional regulator n=1 Tax=Klebsiella pneumoniae TaxID=573 RepID=UPI0029621461|nr:helix-turn-helix domain-containing protein [Klebsiella pneumoniae]MDW1257534.1 helix-turn-helix domain-containing protein [Klebsiella pneumoniae]
MSVTDNIVELMPRNREVVRRLLQHAALDLYQKQGYEQTTTAEIAAQAGVTERTFFRHFPDKREVLFGSEAQLIELLTNEIKNAPRELGPWDTLLCALMTAEPLFIENQSSFEPLRRIIASSPALQERHLAKVRVMTLALAAALVERGVADRQASLTAQMGMTAIGHAVAAWHEYGSGMPNDHLKQVFDDMRALFVP